jgi:hypothetical protein
MQQPASELNKFLAKAGLSIQEEAIPKHCWEVLHCSPEKRETCPAYARRDVPSWVAIGLDKGGRVSEVCVNSTLFDLDRGGIKGIGARTNQAGILGGSSGYLKGYLLS